VVAVTVVALAIRALARLRGVEVTVGKDPDATPAGRPLKHVKTTPS
jgi:hypothetical protein